MLKESTPALLKAIEADRANPSSHESRIELIDALANVMRSAGELFELGKMLGDGRITGESKFGWGDDAIVGLGYALRIAGDLVDGAHDLLKGGNRYSAASLVRQLVECEYLAWAFAENEDEAADWIASDHKERMERWTPARLRKRSMGQFQDRHYRFHCESGGHPSPEGLYLLKGNEGAVAASLACDLVNHALNVWGYAVEAIRGTGWEEVVAALPSIAALDRAYEKWSENDVLMPAITAFLSEAN